MKIKISIADYVPFERVSDEDLLKAKIFNRCRLSDTGCWIWTGSFGAGGYGVFSLRNLDQRAHRASYMIFKGPIPKGLHILHSCDTPACVNPTHLRAGTVKENMVEREARGRRDVRGEQIGTSKLTREQVVEIKKSDIGLKALSEKYGVEAQSIWRIRTGKSWAHVNVSQENVDGN
jgi:HNH endonuclease